MAVELAETDTPEGEEQHQKVGYVVIKLRKRSRDIYTNSVCFMGGERLDREVSHSWGYQPIYLLMVAGTFTCLRCVLDCMNGAA